MTTSAVQCSADGHSELALYYLHVLEAAKRCQTICIFSTIAPFQMEIVLGNLAFEKSYFAATATPRVLPFERLWRVVALKHTVRTESKPFAVFQLAQLKSMTVV